MDTCWRFSDHWPRSNLFRPDLKPSNPQKRSRNCLLVRVVTAPPKATVSTCVSHHRRFAGVRSEIHQHHHTSKRTCFKETANGFFERVSNDIAPERWPLLPLFKTDTKFRWCWHVICSGFHTRRNRICAHRSWFLAFTDLFCSVATNQTRKGSFRPGHAVPLSLQRAGEQLQSWFVSGRIANENRSSLFVRNGLLSRKHGGGSNMESDIFMQNKRSTPVPST